MTYFSRLHRALDHLAQPIVSYPDNSYARQLYYQFVRIRIGQSPLLSFARLVKLSAQLITSFFVTPFFALFRLFGVRFLSIDLTQIGSVIYLDLYLRENRLGRRTPPHKLLVCRSVYSDANPYVLDLYRSYLTFVENPFLKMALSPFFMNPFFHDTTFTYDPVVTFDAAEGKQRTFVHQIWQEHDEKFGAPLVCLDESAIALGREMMAPLIPVGRKFVALHVRDSGFYGSTRKATRNADITTYEPAIRYLIDQGYTVVRMGDANMVAIDDMVARCGPDLIDYAFSEQKSEFLDCYLCSECDFFIGLASGLYALSGIFGRPCCYVNFYNVTIGLWFLATDLTTFKKFRYISDDSLLPFDLLVRPPFSQSPQHRDLEAAGVYLEDNSADEILATVKEFVERDGVNPTPLQKMGREMILKSNYCYGGCGQFSNTILKLYFPDDEVLSP